MVLRNVAKTFSLEEQRQEINEIAVDLDAVNTTLTNWNAAQWDTAYSWGDHAQAGYLVATASSYNNTNWDTAYGWGDHAQGGYLTAYQTDAQIKSSYEANADTNAFTDALLTKLNGIETGATADQTASEIKTAYESNANTNAFTDALQTKLNGIETNATADQTASEIKTAYESNADTNAFTDALQTKLNGIAAGAEVNLDPGGTFAGAGTAQDPAIGSIQFKNTGNTFGGDTLLVYDNTNNRLGINIATPDTTLHLGNSGVLTINNQDGTRKTQLFNDGTFSEWNADVDPIRLNAAHSTGYIRIDTNGGEKLRVGSGSVTLTLNGNTTNDFTGNIYAPGLYSVFGNILVGMVPESLNNNTGYVLLHKLGQGQGMQFAGDIISNSYTGSAFINCHITVRFNDDNIDYLVHNTSNPGIAKVNIQLVTVTYDSATWLALRKNGGGTGVMYFNAFFSGNANNDTYGGMKELVPADVTLLTTVATLNP